MRVLIVAGGYPTVERPQSGIFTQRTARALASRADVRVVQLRSWRPGRAISERTVIDDVAVLRLAAPQLPRRGAALLNVLAFRPIRVFAGLAEELEGADVVHSVGLHAGVIASAWARRRTRPHVMQVNASVLHDEVARAARIPGVARFRDGLDGVVCTSRGTLVELLDRFPKLPDATHAYRGVDLAAFTPEGPRAGPLVDRSPTRFFYAGGFPDYASNDHGRNTKGGETLLDAWAAAEDALVSAGATLLLAGPSTDDRTTRDRVARLRHPEAVIVHDAIPPRDVAAFLRAADVVVHPSMSEGLPNLVVEAAACGRAVLGSDAGGTPEVIAHGETGWIVPAGDVDAWSRALVRAAADRGSWRDAGPKARRRAESSFDARAYPEALFAAYERAIARRRTR